MESSNQREQSIWINEFPKTAVKKALSEDPSVIGQSRLNAV